MCNGGLLITKHKSRGREIDRGIPSSHLFQHTLPLAADWLRAWFTEALNVIALTVSPALMTTFLDTENVARAKHFRHGVVRAFLKGAKRTGPRISRKRDHGKDGSKQNYKFQEAGHWSCFWYREKACFLSTK